MKLPHTPGLHKVSVKDHIDELFALDVKVAAASPYIFPLETAQELSDFLVKEHVTDTYIWNTDEGKLAGYFSIIVNQEEKTLEVLNIGVDPVFQGKGYGRTMMECAEKIAQEHDLHTVMLVTNVKNIFAINFYKKVGYSIAREMKNYYGDGEDRYVFEKSLKI